MKNYLLFTGVLIAAPLFGKIEIFQNSNQRGGINLQNVVNTGNTILNGGGVKVTNDEVVKGLKEALNVGISKSVEKASAVNGFFKNPAIFIPFPKEVEQVKTTLSSVGMKPQVDKFVETLNRAAELAAKDAAPIFINAITSMSLNDGISILKGNETAATNYLKTNTNEQLKVKFLPVVKSALQKVQITKYWNPLAKKYNKIPMTKRVNPNLEDYVSTRAIEGLFKLVGDEETKIRKDPASRVSDLLKKVFG
jgi:hypothetical protein